MPQNSPNHSGSPAGTASLPSHSASGEPVQAAAAGYAELHCVSNFTFLRGASSAEELINTAAELGYRALAITDECSLAGVVRAHVARKALLEADHEPGSEPLKLITGSEFVLCPPANEHAKHKTTPINQHRAEPDTELTHEGCHFVALAPNRKAYGQLSHLISFARRQAKKGEYFLDKQMLEQYPPSDCLLLWIPRQANPAYHAQEELGWLRSLFPQLWIAAELLMRGDDRVRLGYLQDLGKQLDIPLCAAGGVYMHNAQRRVLQDTVTAIRLLKPIHQLGFDAEPNGQRHLRHREQLQKLYPAALLQETLNIAARCHFDLDELRYEYPAELVPANSSADQWLRTLTEEGVRRRWPEGESAKVRRMIEHELTLIKELEYEHYFLTVQDVVAFAKGEGIICQGRGSAANSVVCYCLGITEVNPDQTQLLFERFVSKERNEPPDIDVDFENARREEVIQYIYNKYGRHRAAIAATVITYRSRSAIRDVGKALAMDEALVDHLAKSVFWWGSDLEQQLSDAKVDFNDPQIKQLLYLAELISGFPRHLSQHVGGFIISKGPLSELVPIENAAMVDRSIIQWDKDDLEALGLLKIDVLALGMLTAIRKGLDLINSYLPHKTSIQTIPKEDPAVYDMICEADTVGVFQIESRAQMSMLPRLKPRNYYDLVIQIAIVRPGPIQGDMVHPFLRRRSGKEQISYESKEIEQVLSRTLGVPIFQEQVMQIAMVAAGFGAGEADQLRRAMAAWKKKGGLEPFKEKLIGGMSERGYSEDFADRIYRQITGFAEYGFPESHSASFALIAYVSCWFKHYHPAAFCCALLNSQPMGFYPPAQLVQDARRHGVEVLPVHINHSQTESSLEFNTKAMPRLYQQQELQADARVDPKHGPKLRLGFNRVKGLSADAAEWVYQNRQQQPYASVQDLVIRTGINKKDLEALAAADVLRSLSGNRHQAFWQAAGTALGRKGNNARALASKAVGQTDSTRQLSFYNNPNTASAMDMDNDFGNDVLLPVPGEALDILSDYDATGLTLRRHPVALLREHLDNYQVSTAKSLHGLETESFAKVTGLVTSRQRPQTASGVTFLTLEDESGFINVVVWPKLGERQRPIVRQAMLIGVLGKVQVSEGVVHLIARELVDLSSWLGEGSFRSRNFC